MLKAAIVGYGGISRAHKPGYERLEKEGKVRLVGAYDIDPEAFTMNKRLNIPLEKTEFDKKLNFYTDLDEMLEREQPDFVDICAPTYVHKELAVKILNKGFNVLCEKPMALTAADAEEMLEAAKRNGKHLMIAQCVRFGADMQYVKQVIEDGRYGKPLSALCTRCSLTPNWGYEQWFCDPKRSGGCLTDMHIHDIDLLRYLFGDPEAVSCRRITSNLPSESVHTSLFFDGISATAIGEWTTKTLQFSRAYRFTFERAAMVIGSEFKVYPEDGEPFVPDLKRIDSYEAEISYFCDVIEGKTENRIAPPTDTLKTMCLIEAMRKSADAAGDIVSL